MKIRNLIPIICVAFSLLSTPCIGGEPTFKLTPEEKAWIAKKHTVHVRIGNAPPFMLTIGKIEGMAIDYLVYIFNRNGIKFKYIQESEVTWPQALNYIKQHEVVDMVPTAKITDERKKYMLFTDEYLFAPWVIFTRTDAEFLSSIDDLKGKTVSVEEGFVMHKKLKQDYPEINLKIAPANLANITEKPIKDLSTGLVDAYIGNLIMTTYILQTKGYTNIKVAAPTPFDDHNQAMAIRNDWPELVSIVNKTLNAMTSEEHAAIRNRWLTVKYEYGVSKIDILKWVVGISFFSLIIFVVFLFWNRKLKQEVENRKKSEDKLFQLNSTLEAAQDMAKVGYWSYDIKTKMPTWSKQMFVVFGVDPQKGVPHYDDHKKIWHPDDWELFDTSVNNCVTKGEHYNIEVRIIFPDKSLHYIHTQGFADFDQDGKIIELFGTSQDITERKRTDEKLRESEKRFRDITQSMADWIWEVDKNGKYTYVSDTVKNILGYSSEELIGKTPFELMSEKEARKINEIFLQIVLKQGVIVDLENWNLAKDGTEVCLLTNGVPIVSANGKLKGYRGIDKDISDQKKIEIEKAEIEAQLRQAQKMEAVGTLAGGIAHDFNNILGAIIGYAEMARDDSPKESTVVKDLDKVLEASDRAASLVKQILAFSRQGDAEHILLSPADIVKKTITMLRPTLPTTIEITKDIDPGAGLIFADPTQIHQILMNLCTNAFHAMEETGGKLDISLKEVDLSTEDLIHEPHIEAGTFIKLSVCDSGPGMTKEVKDKIFDPYYTTKEVGKGTGLGLFTVHGIVKSYGGFLTLYSQPGEGTTFHVFLPIIDTGVLPDNEAIQQIPFGVEKILFIDDEEILADMGKDILERLGYHVTVRKSSLEALETFRDQPDQFDLVITDQTMPGMTGADLARRMLQIRPDIPIILCTGYSSIITEEKTKSIGIREFVLKPLTKKNVAKLIRKVLDGN